MGLEQVACGDEALLPHQASGDGKSGKGAEPMAHEVFRGSQKWFRVQKKK